MEKNKNRKIIITLFVIVAVVAIITAVCFFILPNFKKSKVELKDEEYTKELQNVSEEYIDNDTIVYDENGKARNRSNDLSLEKIFSDVDVGMSGFKVKNNENEETTVTFTVKNHTNDVVKPFKYTLQFMNIDDSVKGTVELETQTLPALGIYNVTLHLDKDVLDVYNIVPVSEVEMNQSFGGGF